MPREFRLAPALSRARAPALRPGTQRPARGAARVLPEEAANRLDTNAGGEGEGGRGAGVRPGCGAASPRNVQTS